MSSFNTLTELEDLRLFLQERVQEYDNSIDTSLGSTFDNTVIQPLLARIGPDPYATDIVNFIRGRLRAEFGNDVILQDGEPIDDLVIKPNRLLLEPYRRQIRLVSLNQSLAEPELLNEREADNLGANWFVRRRLGGFSVGSARLYYTSPQFALVTPSNSVFTGEGLRFFPIENQAIPADRMVFNEEDNLFYFDIVVRAEQQGSEYNITYNTLVGIEGQTSVVKVTNKRDFGDGGNKESTVAFIERVEQSLTEKSLVTVRGINARLTDTFDNVRLIQVTGFGDPEMNRDILTGDGSSAPYAYAQLVLSTSSDLIDLYTAAGTPIVPVGSSSLGSDFSSADVQTGDIIEIPLTATGDFYRFTVTELVTSTRLRVTPVSPVSSATFYVGTIRRAVGGITISDIPGGILGPDPAIEINSGEVHIGGALDVFVRGGDPQDRDLTLEGVLDANPLRFGVDLETYGGGADRFSHVTEAIPNRAALPAVDRVEDALPELTELVIQRVAGSSPSEFNPWIPTEEDVDRYIQIIPSSASTNYRGTFRIAEVIGNEYYLGVQATRIRIDKDDKERNNDEAEWITASDPAISTFSVDFRIVELDPITNWVRDRDGSNVALPAAAPNPIVLGGVDFQAIGTSIGDSVVLETGGDAGIYSIRRILTWLTDNDTLILDRDLTSNKPVVTPGSHTGIRYRVADELNVDLVAPKVPKIPLGDIFTGDDLSTSAGNVLVSATGSTNFIVAGVEIGDTLEILEGDNANRYGIVSVASTQVELGSPPLNTGTLQTFEVYRASTGIIRPMVRIEEVELLDSNSQPTGISIPYGDNIDARVLGGMSNRAQGEIIESFTGELQDNGAGLFDLYDPNTDFDSEGVESGHRLNILSGLSVRSYTILATGTDPSVGLSEHYLRVMPLSAGGTAFGIAEVDVHYSAGLPSSGFVRLFFLEPTSVEIETGLAGGRLQSQVEGEVPKVFQFSAVPGRTIVPSPGSEDDDGRDFRACRTYLETLSLSWSTTGTGDSSVNTFTDPGASFLTAGIRSSYILRITSGADIGDYDIASVDSETELTILGSAFPVGDTNKDYEIVRYNSIVELADPNRPGVYELEIEEGDVVEVNEPIPFRVPNKGGSFTGQTFREAGVFGSPAGLRTIAGSNQVSVPANSLIDFNVMDADFPLVGQSLYIESGPDSGQYLIEEIISDKVLRLNQTLTSTSATIEARDINARTGLSLSASGSNTKLTDTDDKGQISLLADGQFITMFESTRGDVDGIFSISDTLSAKADSLEIETSVNKPGIILDDQTVGPFSWIATSVNTLVSHPFHIYKTTPTEFEVLEVAPKRTDITGIRRGTINSGTSMTDVDSGNLVTLGVSYGDIVEVLEGVSQGVYTVKDRAGSIFTIHSEVPFPAIISGVAYRVWGGLQGSRRMLLLGPKDSGAGRALEGDLIPYRILRPGIFRVSSTEMEENFDGTLYYVDVQVESEGSGDDLNLSEGARMVVTNGLTADGYTYSVENKNLTFSVFEEVSINFDRRFLPVGNSDSPENLTEVSGRNLKVAYETSTTTQLVDDLLRGERDRPVNANPLARHFLPSYLYASFQYSGGVSEQAIGPDMEDLVNSLGAEEEIRVSDLEKLLIQRGADSIEHPSELVTITHDLGRNLVVNRSDNKLGGNNAVPYEGTGRISAFFTVFGETLLLVRES